MSRLPRDEEEVPYNHWFVETTTDPLAVFPKRNCYAPSDRDKRIQQNNFRQIKGTTQEKTERQLAKARRRLQKRCDLWNHQYEIEKKIDEEEDDD